MSGLYRYSRRSQNKLSTCHPALQSLFSAVIKHRDCTITCGHRCEDDQERAFKSGASQLRWPNGPHNAMPSLAVDAYPYIDGAISFDREQCLVFAGFVIGLAGGMGIKIRWGGDWDGDHNLREHSLSDLGHFELVL